MADSPNQIQEPASQYWADFFVYNAAVTNLAPSGVSQQTIQIQADSAFKWLQGTYEVDNGGVGYNTSAIPYPLVTVQITDGATGRALFSNPAPVPTLFGAGQLPFILPQPKVFMPNSTVTLAFANFSTAITYTLRLQLIGAKIFKGKSQQNGW